MFYESFFPDPKQQYVWVRESKSLPYVKGTGETFKRILVRVVPSSLTEPKTEQQGSLEIPLWRHATGDGIPAKIVLYPRRLG